MGSTPSWRINNYRFIHRFPEITFKKGVRIKFRARVSGIFEIIQPALEKGEVFDSNLLKETLNGFIAEGKRNFAIDLSPLDYIYSDAINIILALNRRILDVSGRLSLLSPSPEVRSILERTGLHNILKIYETETDLLQSSEDIILQTTRFNLSDLKGYQQPQAPKSEYDDFKSEISTAMAPAAPAQPMESADPYEALDTEIPEETFRAKPEPKYQEPFAAAPAPRQPAKEQDFGPLPQREPTPKRKEPKPAPLQQTSFAGEPELISKVKQERTFSAPEPSTNKQGHRPPERDFDRFARDDNDDDFEEKPKRSFIPILAGIIILLVVGVGIISFFAFSKKSDKPVAVQAPVIPAPQRAMPEISQPPAPAAAVAPAPAPANAPEVAQKPAVAPAPVKEPAIEKPIEKQPPAKQASKSTARQQQAAVGKLTITSKPSGATLIVDGRVLGTTPYKWIDAPLAGIVITVSKRGYSDAIKTVEYNGGNQVEAVMLTKEAPAPKSEPAPREVQEPASPPPAPASAPEPEPVVSSPPPSSNSSGESATIFISSMPPVADVYMDGKLIGKTNISKLNVTPGAHSMRFVKGTVEVTEDMTFKQGDNPSHFLILKK